MQEQTENWIAGTAQQQQKQPNDKSFLARKKNPMCDYELSEKDFSISSAAKWKLKVIFSIFYLNYKIAALYFISIFSYIGAGI